MTATAAMCGSEIRSEVAAASRPLAAPLFYGESAMAAFMQMKGIDGEATDKNHDKWILIESMSSSIHRSITDGARDMERVRGRTTTADVVVVRQLDKSSTKIEEACANGTFYDQVEINFCTTVGNAQEPYLKYTLHDVIVTSYGCHCNAEAQPRPSEEITLGYTKVEWEYVEIDPKTGKKKGSVPASYDPGKGSSK
jgi:type VI secretion system secreted protein Hcp